MREDSKLTVNHNDIPLLASVVICTRNRAGYLSKTLQEAAKQTLSNGRFEILVVDNGSTDRTPEVVRECQSSMTQVPIRYVVESEIGLSAARNRAVREAKGDILCFLDDDAFPEETWLERIVGGFSAGVDVMCVGGAIIPIYPYSLPDWFEGGLEYVFKPSISDSELHEVRYPKYPYGANFAVRAKVFREIGFFNLMLGYRDRKLIPCEETELLLRIEKAGYRILMEPCATVRHVIPESRLQPGYLRQLYHDYGKGHVLMLSLHNPVSEYGSSFHYLTVLIGLIFQNLSLRFKIFHMRLNKCFGSTVRFSTECEILSSLGKLDQEIVIVTEDFFKYSAKK